MANTQPPASIKPQISPNGDHPADEAQAAHDPFDPARFRVNAMADIEVEKVLTTVPVRPPKRTEFFRVHPGRDYSEDMYLLQRADGMDKETYLVDPAVQHLVLQELRPVRLFTAINKHGKIFLWPVKLPSDDHDRLRQMANSALLGAEQAKALWVKLVWDKHLGAWEMYRAKGDLGSPQWPTDKSFRDLLEIAFRDYFIGQPDHEVIRELTGEM